MNQFYKVSDGISSLYEMGVYLYLITLNVEINMKKLLILLLFAIAQTEGYPQLLTFPNEAPNYKAIKADIEDPSSVFYYAKLLPRLMGNDTTLNNQDYRHLYYGYIYQKK